MTYKYALEERVTVQYPASKRYPRGRSREGVVSRRGVLPGFEASGRVLKRYAVLFDDDTADVLIPEYWLHPVDQLELTA